MSLRAAGAVPLAAAQRHAELDPHEPAAWGTKRWETMAVRMYSFDPTAGHRIDQFGSSFTLSPLTNPDGLARAACFHLVAGEAVGEHRALIALLFGVVDGSGWVSGSDEVRTPIRAEHAAYWSPGEKHAAGTDIGMTAIVLEGDGFEVWANPLNKQS